MAREISVRRARREDLPEIVRLLADDELGSRREQFTLPLPEAYYDAFREMDGDPHNWLVVAEAGGEIVGTLQLTFIAGLTHQGARRAQIEAALEREPNPAKRFLKILGPGFITGASDDDPSGIGTYAVAGATFGFATLWTALVTFPLMASVQFICAKVGMVSGMGLAGVLRRHYSRWFLYPAVLVLVVANTINAGADIGAIWRGFTSIPPTT